ncbi:hypothetical protein MRB53_028367 [Persea americana]|uniref:Uncharacterized protein n=1 Tax=Persea americana TaxID=3435 RepID=A0ACC2KFI4_PERAE|nr:hypothetical protein MRB53_028367 [Persea americana]
MPCPAASDAGTADVASACDTVVTAMPEVAVMLGVTAEPYTEEPEHMVVVAEEVAEEEEKEQEQEEVPTVR